MKSDNITIGDEIKKNNSFELNPDNLRVYMSSKNILFVNHFHNVLKKYWKKHNRTKPFNEVFFNKVLSELIRKNKSLNFITRGWYLYGVEIAKPLVDQPNFIPTTENLTRGTNFSEKKIQELDSKLLAIARVFDCNGTPFSWEGKQYELFKDLVYKAKLNFQCVINSKDFHKLNKKLSVLSLNLNIKKYEVTIGKLMLLNFVDIAKKIIISNNYNIPNMGRFKKAFNSSWNCFGNVNLYLTAEGIDADKIKINVSEKINNVSKKAHESNKELVKDIKITKSSFRIKPGNIGKNIVKNLYSDN